MDRARVLALSFFVAFAFSAIAAGSAQAGWLVLGSLVFESEQVNMKTVVDKPFSLSWSTSKITCKKLQLSENTTIKEPDKFLSGGLEFAECTSLPAECVLQNGRISTLPIEGLVTLDGALAVKAIVKPDTGKTIFATFFFEEEKGCAEEGKQAITGTATILAPTGQDERLLQLINALITTAGELKVGEAAATIEGSALVSLVSDMPWSFD